MSSSSSDLPDGSEPISQWVRDLQDPDRHEEAAAKLSQKYRPLLEWRMAELVGDEVRGKVGEESVVQETLASFFRRRAMGQYKIKDRNGLWALLGRIAYNKFCSRVKAEQTDKRTPGKAERKKFAAEHGDPEDQPGAERVWEANVAPQDLEAGKKLVSRPDEKQKRGYRKKNAADRSQCATGFPIRSRRGGRIPERFGTVRSGGLGRSAEETPRRSTSRLSIGRAGTQ